MKTRSIFGGYVTVRDKKDREFEVEYSIHKGRRAMFDPNFGNYYPDDPDEITIEGATVTLGLGKRTKFVDLTEKQLLKYVSLDSVYDAIYDHASFTVDN